MLSNSRSVDFLILTLKLSPQEGGRLLCPVIAICLSCVFKEFLFMKVILLFVTSQQLLRLVSWRILRKMTFQKSQNYTKC